MVKSYHVIFTPLFDWSLYIPDEVPRLNFLMSSIKRLFSFKCAGDFRLSRKREVTAEEREKLGIHSPILASRLPLLRHEIRGVWDITDLLNKYCKEEVNNLKIEKSFISNFAFEIVSSSSKILRLGLGGGDIIYQHMAEKMSSGLFKGVWNGDAKEEEISVLAIVSLLNVIVCEKPEEIEQIVSDPEYEFKKEIENFYITGINAFNFIENPWSDLFLKNFIVILDPEKLIFLEKSADEVGPYIALANSLGKLYTISKSIKGISANLEYYSWFLDNFFLSFEKSFNFVKRNFTNLEKRLFDVLINVRQTMQPFTLLTTSPESIRNIHREYGGDFFPHIGDSLTTISHFLCEEYIEKPNEIGEAILNDLKMLSENIKKFLDRFQNAANTWREFHQGKLTHNMLILAMLALLVTIILGLVNII